MIRTKPVPKKKQVITRKRRSMTSGQSRHRKNKGQKLQKWVCQQISDLLHEEWGMPGDDKPIEARRMGEPGCDVRLESRLLKRFPFSVECKNCETWKIPGWIEQAKSNTMKDTSWILVVKRNNQNPIVVMGAEEFFDLVAQTIYTEVVYDDAEES